MTILALILWIIAGLLTGMVARRVMPGTGLSITLGVVGAVLAGFILGGVLRIGSFGLVLPIIEGVIGAVMLLAVYRLVAGPKTPRSNYAEHSGASMVASPKNNNTVNSQKAARRTESSRAGTYDVFISYRRQHGAETARLIRSALKDRNVRAFLDVDDLRAGHFDRELLTRIAETPNFIIVLTPHALDRCVNEQDWLRQEIVQAIKTDSNIVPIMMPGFQFPEPHVLPQDVRGLRTYQSIGYSHEFFDAMIDRSIQYLQ
jgi:uncharacterized membrane protein YeaQ/YmgE (transglycosylase-associated protein family)